MWQLSGEKGNIKKQLIYWCAKKKAESPRPPEGLGVSAARPKNAKNMQKMAFSVTSADG